MATSWTYVRGWRCSQCGTDHLEPQPNLFRFNGPLGACPVCEGVGQTTELDLARIVPDDSRTIREGAIAPWTTPGYRGYLQELLDAAAQIDIPVNVPFRELAAEKVRRLVEGVPGAGFAGLKGFVRGARAPGVQTARPGLPRPVEALPELSGMPRGRGCVPRRWPSGSRGETSPSCRR